MKIKDVKWKPLSNEIGMKPRFRVFCSQCMMSYYEALCVLMLIETRAEAFPMENWYLTLNKFQDGFFDMILRECFCSPLPTIGENAYHNDMHYKCAKSYGCDAVKTFGVPVDKEYYEALMQRRKGQARIQPREDWDKDEDLKKQLKSMGYL